MMHHKPPANRYRGGRLPVRLDAERHARGRARTGTDPDVVTPGDVDDAERVDVGMGDSRPAHLATRDGMDDPV